MGVRRVVLLVGLALSFCIASGVGFGALGAVTGGVADAQTTKKKSSTTKTKPTTKATTTTTAAPTTTTAPTTTIVAAVAPTTPDAPLASVQPAYGINSEQRDDSASRRLQLIVIGLLILAVVIALATLFFWYTTRPVIPTLGADVKVTVTNEGGRP